MLKLSYNKLVDKFVFRYKVLKAISNWIIGHTTLIGLGLIQWF